MLLTLLLVLLESHSRAAKSDIIYSHPWDLQRNFHSNNKHCPNSSLHHFTLEEKGWRHYWLHKSCSCNISAKLTLICTPHTTQVWRRATHRQSISATTAPLRKWEMKNRRKSRIITVISSKKNLWTIFPRMRRCSGPQRISKHTQALQTNINKPDHEK